MSKANIFTPENKTIKDIFTLEDSFYEVPNYQRPYKWNTDQVQQLWEDLFDSYDNWKNHVATAEAYFLGSIILIKNSDHYEIVDGQQRLTTLTILFSVMRDLFTMDTTLKNDLKNCIKATENSRQRMRFVTSIDRQNEFEKNILNEVKISKNSDTKKSFYLNTAQFFSEELTKLSPLERESFTSYILNNVQLITITCHDKSFAIKLFQVLNARGLKLSASDLVKSYLMGNLPEKQHNQFISDWRAVETIAKKLDDSTFDMDNYLNYYLYFLKGSNPQKGIYSEFLDAVKGRNSNEVVLEFKNFIDSYNTVMSFNDKCIYALRYLSHDSYWKSILTTAHYKGKNDVIELAKILRNFYYAHWVAGYTSTKIKHASFKVIKMITDENSSNSEIKKYLTEVSENNATINLIKLSLTRNVYNQKWLKPLLLIVEYSQVDQVFSFIKITKDLHAEHVLPKKFQSIAQWNELYEPEVGNLILNTLPNMALLSGAKNIEASNSAFADKIDVYSGAKNPKLTAFKTTQWIRDRYVNDHINWDINAIELRFDWLINQISEEMSWDITDVYFSDIINKKTITTFPPRDDMNEHSPVKFHKECLGNFSKTTKLEYEKTSTAIYKSSSDEIVICKVSKRYDGRERYWFRFNPEEKEILDKSPLTHKLLLGCGNPNTLIALPGHFLLPHLDSLNVTSSADVFYWHIHIEKNEGKFYLKKAKSEKVDINQFLVFLDFNNAA